MLSHMRSYSSVLSHVLGSHPEITGYAEMHQAYRRPIDFLRLRVRVMRSTEGRLDGRFVLDKVLHDRYPVAAEILDREDVRPIFLVRAPRDAIESIIGMGQDVTNVDWYSDPAAVADYYARRVRTLAQIGRSMASSALFVRAESVLEDTTTVLADITEYLALESPLAPSYTTFAHTGEPGFGDYSDRIRTGRIVSEPRRSDRPAVAEAILDEARAAYDDCLAAVEPRRAAATAEAGA